MAKEKKLTKKQLLAQQQKKWICDYQNGTITETDADELILSLRGIVNALSKKFLPSFPNVDINELMSDGYEALWPALKKYDVTRALPSTYTYNVVRTSLLKRWYKNKHTKKKMTFTDSFGQDVVRHDVSLDSYSDEYGDINEMGVSDEASEFIYHETLQMLFDEYCHDTDTFKIMDCILNPEKLQEVAGRRTKQTINNIAYATSTSRDRVETVLDILGPVMNEHEIFARFSKFKYKTPVFVDVMNVDIVDIVLRGVKVDACDMMQHYL